MKRFILIIILILNLQSWTKADDISDFEIEGISIGDSLLDHFSVEEIDKSLKVYHKDKKYIFANFSENLEIYNRIQVGYKNKDKNYKIELINGVIFFDQDIDKCHIKQDSITNEIASDFSTLAVEGPEEQKHSPVDSSSPVTVRWFLINNKNNNNNLIKIYCINHPIANNKQDKLKIQISTDDMIKYLASQQ